MAIPGPLEDDLAKIGGIEGLKDLIPDDGALETLSARFKALADPMRLKILLLLAPGPFCVCVIREVLGIADSRLSYHLNVLKKAGLIAGEQQGTWIIYSLTDEGEEFAARLAGAGHGRA
ncbi:ArsR family transcriptional regulator [Methanofollis formosanus]|uniref:ArsR family transcriptional regulator n=1 Tax=Methanofollis formosanus TaxID=299308 RepID=A0A8G1EFW5_9EURY|nr:metalloregulator ArsR/SmtB family transcription factor [Methanofollis formosanus]QYZ79170.1 ArsR family transcriptional regulator [Methanofollis formosanus]